MSSIIQSQACLFASISLKVIICEFLSETEKISAESDMLIQVVNICLHNIGDNGFHDSHFVA